MAKSAYEKVRDAMAPETKKQTTQELCFLLALFEGCELDEAERIAQAVISEELCKRHPEADEAAEKWSWDLESTETVSAVIIRTALAANS